MPVIKLPQMTPEEIERVLQEKSLCRVAYQDGELPYISPFQYVYLNRTLYLHMTRYGKKTQLHQLNRHVCIEIEDYTPDLSNYAFVALKGTLVNVTDLQERQQALDAMAAYGNKHLSTEFLLAHGFDPAAGWNVLTKDPSLAIFKLVNIIEQVGLKSRNPF